MSVKNPADLQGGSLKRANCCQAKAAGFTVPWAFFPTHLSESKSVSGMQTALQKQWEKQPKESSVF